MAPVGPGFFCDGTVAQKRQMRMRPAPLGRGLRAACRPRRGRGVRGEFAGAHPHTGGYPAFCSMAVALLSRGGPWPEPAWALSGSWFSCRTLRSDGPAREPGVLAHGHGAGMRRPVDFAFFEGKIARRRMASCHITVISVSPSGTA